MPFVWKSNLSPMDIALKKAERSVPVASVALILSTTAPSTQAPKLGIAVSGSLGVRRNA